MIGNEIIFLPEVSSTNQYLIGKISVERLKEGTLVWAFRQTAGMGLDKNTWESEPGKNLTFSFVLYPHFMAPDQQFRLNQSIVLGLMDLIRNVLPLDQNISVKWPNDVYIGNRKVAGILIQNGVKGKRFEYSVIGIGLNVNQESFSPEIPNPVSLKMVSGKEYHLANLLLKAVQFLQARIERLMKGNYDELDKEYLENLFRYGIVQEYFLKGERIIARITGVSKYGQLLLEIPGERTIECDLKEVGFVF